MGNKKREGDEKIPVVSKVDIFVTRRSNPMERDSYMCFRQRDS